MENHKFAAIFQCIYLAFFLYKEHARALHELHQDERQVQKKLALNQILNLMGLYLNDFFSVKTPYYNMLNGKWCSTLENE